MTGAARYAAEFNVPGLCHGYVVGSTIARGKIVSIDTAEALKLPGVLTVFTHENQPKTAWLDRHWQDAIAPSGSPMRYLHGTDVRYSMQPVALVVAESFETARAAARLVKVEYKESPHKTDLAAEMADARPPAGGAAGFVPPPSPAAIRTRPTPPPPPGRRHVHAADRDAQPDGDVRLHRRLRGRRHADHLRQEPGLPEQPHVRHQRVRPQAGQVKVKNPFVGGGFGSGLRPQYQLYMATMAAIELKRSVRVVLSRPEMWSIGHRPACVQHVRLAADDAGKLQAILHEATTETSTFEDYAETIVNWSAQAYQCDNVKVDYKVVR